MVSQGLFQGVLGEGGKSPVGSVVQWFFRNALLPCGVCALASQTFGVKINRRRAQQGGGK